MSSARSVSSSKARRRISARSRGAVAAQSARASPAARMAASASAAEPSATVVMISPVAGLCTSMVLPPSADRHWPSMNRPVLSVSMIGLMSTTDPPWLSSGHDRVVSSRGSSRRSYQGAVLLSVLAIGQMRCAELSSGAGGAASGEALIELRGLLQESVHIGACGAELQPRLGAGFECVAHQLCGQPATAPLGVDLGVGEGANGAFGGVVGPGLTVDVVDETDDGARVGEGEAFGCGIL